MNQKIKTVLKFSLIKKPLLNSLNWMANILGTNDTQKDYKELSDAAAGAIENVAGAETEDPYAYLHRPNFSSENFKIEIMNLPKYYGAGVTLILLILYIFATILHCTILTCRA